VGVLTLLILAVSCANLGGLMLARAVAREREMSIRIAIGASREHTSLGVGIGVRRRMHREPKIGGATAASTQARSQ